MAYQPPSRTRFYRDKRKGKVMGICAGIADYTGFDVTLVRIAHDCRGLPEQRIDPARLFHRRLDRPDRPRELENSDGKNVHFWRSVRQSPTRTARDIRLRLKDVDRRLADVESTSRPRTARSPARSSNSAKSASRRNHELRRLIPIAGILAGVAIMWICYKYLELRVVGRKTLEEADREHVEKKRLEANSRCWNGSSPIAASRPQSRSMR